MAKEFKLPDLGEGIHEAQIINIHVKEGDTVREDQMIMEVETDKAAVEIPVPFAGVVSRLHVKSGDNVKVGQVLLAVETAGGEAPPSPTPARAPAAPPRTAPATTPARAPAPPAVPRREPAPAITASQPARAAAEATRRSETVEPRGPIPAAPAIRRLAREMNIDLTQVRGTGPGGRIVREDLERYSLAGPSGTGVAPRRAEPTAPATVAPSLEPGRPASTEPLPDFSQWGPIRREAITQIRKTIARQMVRSYTIVPHVTHCDVADVTDLENFRKQQSAAFQQKGAKLTLTAFVIKAVASALQQHPILNCSFDEAAGEIIYKDYVHVGVAVDTPRGLVVPALRNCESRSLVKISMELADLAERARSAKFEIAELRGGTFTITNVGPLGGTFVTPMINYPEVGILGLGRTALQPAVRDGQIVPRMQLPLSLSFDHRVVDGADAARFVRTVIGYLENPLNLLLVS
ncbi:MAG: 2-oxo acid dehydrogenase subunit E2 [Phycisphaerae bacterium]|nr:2-oxo acid dehydrogenase subunit E2 [Phycisphaerae bacterium]